MKKIAIILLFATLAVSCTRNMLRLEMSSGEMTVAPGIEIKPENLDYEVTIKDFMDSGLDLSKIKIVISKGTGLYYNFDMPIPEFVINTGKYTIDSKGIQINAVVTSTLPFTLKLTPESEGSVCTCSPSVKEGTPDLPTVSNMVITIHCDNGVRKMKTINIGLEAIHESDSHVLMTPEMGMKLHISSLIVTDGIDISY